MGTEHSDFDRLSATAMHDVNNACDRFERAWRESKTDPLNAPSIDMLLNEFKTSADDDPELLRRALFGQILKCDVDQRIQRGWQVDESSYRSHFAEFERVLNVFDWPPTTIGGVGNDATQDTSIDGPPPTTDGSYGHQQRTPISAIREDPNIGLRLREYTLTERLGKGGMGLVYRATHERLGRQDAVKLLSARDGHAIERFLREVRAAGRLQDHPNIVRAYDAGDVNGIHFLVMELIEGPDLRVLVKKLGRLPIQEACELARQSALALQEAHASGMVHRDVKPSNLLLAKSGNVKLADLGLAQLRDDDGDMTGVGAGIGTADFMAPEQATDARSVDARADVYSLGCAFYFLLTGHAPYEKTHVGTAAKWSAHSREAVPNVRNTRKDVPADVAHLTKQMMAKDPNQRPSLAAVIDLLSEAAEGADTRGLWQRFQRAEPTSQPRQEPARADAINPRANVAITATLISVAMLLIFWFVFRDPLGSSTNNLSPESTEERQEKTVVPPEAQPPLGTEDDPYLVSIEGNSAYQTIREALQAAEQDENDISYIEVDPGEYHESLNVKSSVRIRGATPIVDADGNRLKPPRHKTTRIVGIEQPATTTSDVDKTTLIRLENVVIQDESDASNQFNSVDIGGGTVELIQCELSSSQWNCIKVRGDSDVTVRACHLAGAVDQFAISREYSSNQNKPNKQAGLVVEKCTFNGLGIHIDGGRAEITECLFEKYQALHIENHQAAVVRVTGCEFKTCPDAIYIYSEEDDNHPDHQVTFDAGEWDFCSTALFTTSGTITFNPGNTIKGGGKGIVVSGGKVTLDQIDIQECSTAGVEIASGILDIVGGNIIGCENAVLIWPNSTESVTATLREVSIDSGTNGLNAILPPNLLNASVIDVKVNGGEFKKQTGACLLANGCLIKTEKVTLTPVPSGKAKLTVREGSIQEIEATDIDSQKEEI